MKPQLLAPLVLACALVGVLPARAASSGPLVDALRARQARLDAVLKAKQGELTAKQREELGDALAGILDFEAMGKAALGEEWGKHTEAERKQYLKSFEGLVRANSLRRVEVYEADSIDYTEEKVEGERGSARTTVKSKKATTEVVYDFARVGGKWRVVDYSIDGVSAVKNYKSQFAKIVQKKGFAGLVERLDRRKAEIEAGGDGA